MTQEIKLDRYDLALLRALQRNARASLQELSAEVGLSSSPCWARVKRMEEGGLIQGYHARLDRTKAGFPITAFVSIRYPVTSRFGEEPAIAALVNDPQVLECHHVAGEDCYVLKVAATSIEGLEAVLRRIKEPGTPVSTRTTIVLSSVFEKPGIAPVEDD